MLFASQPGSCAESMRPSPSLSRPSEHSPRAPRLGVERTVAPLSEWPFVQLGSCARSVRPSPSLSIPSEQSSVAVVSGGEALTGGTTVADSAPLVAQSGSCAESVRPSSSLSIPSEQSGPGCGGVVVVAVSSGGGQLGSWSSGATPSQSGAGFSVNVALSVRGRSMANEHRVLPEQASVHPSNVDPLDAEALAVTRAPIVNLYSQERLQDTSLGVISTRPIPLPSTETVSSTRVPDVVVVTPALRPGSGVPASSPPRLANAAITP
ncbi:MAG: hypothetical protein QOG42_411, partial [Solirubrobacteraceae bacterium]|nr:hypothetical protein [Solirubrobacteraceae bacterium]